MNDDDDVIVDDEGSVTRWIPAAVVSVALAGFIGLAWYAYHSGTQSINEADLVVIEADKTPMKEKPLDPGGMKFPNQDKTIFDTFANGNQPPPNVERVIPAPEEPMNKNMDTSETQTWINDKLKNGEGNTEQMIGSKKTKQEETAQAQSVDAIVKNATPSTSEPKMAGEEPQNDNIITHIAKPENKEVKLTEPAAKPAKVTAPKTTPEKTAKGTAKIQLGAYGSEDEAKAAWKRMQAKFPELTDKTVYVVKADLGAKGIFYRLRAGGIGDAKTFCARLAAKGQGCLPVS